MYPFFRSRLIREIPWSHAVVKNKSRKCFFVFGFVNFLHLFLGTACCHGLSQKRHERKNKTKNGPSLELTMYGRFKAILEFFVYHSIYIYIYIYISDINTRLCSSLCKIGPRSSNYLVFRNLFYLTSRQLRELLKISLRFRLRHYLFALKNLKDENPR